MRSVLNRPLSPSIQLTTAFPGCLRIPCIRQALLSLALAAGLGCAALPGDAAATASDTRSARSEKKASPKNARAAKPASKNKSARPARPPLGPLVGTGPSYEDRPEAQAFAQELAERHQMPLPWLRQVLGEARQSNQVMKLILPPASPQSKNWRAYRSRFLDEPRISAGLAFWQAHAAELERAEKTYGVPAEIVVGILGVETIYGREMGRFRVLDALSTLAFDFPAAHPRAAERQAFFRKELEHFLVQQRAAGSAPTTALGSFAGARGMPQFMPSSQAHFAVDFNRDGRIDLSASASDVIGSVAHYLKAFNWQPGLPTHYPVRFDESRLDMNALMAPDILPTFSVASFSAKGAVLEGPALAHPGPLALIELLNAGDAPSYVAGTENFYVITRYNWSSYYAMAVIDLGQEIAARRSKLAR